MKIQSAVKSSAFTLGASLIAISAAAPGANAQETGDTEASQTLDDSIVVTAMRREQSAQDAPVAIAAYGAEAIDKLQAVQLSELTNFTTNTQVNYPYGEGGPANFVIRGISSTDYSPNQSKPVAIYQDESIRNLQALEVTPLYDVQRVEILRGPQGTLYGKNATGGAINIVSQAPGFDTEGYLTLGYGNFNRIRVQGAVQTPLVEDVLAVRVAGIYVHDDGVFENITPGLGDLNQTDVFSMRGSLYFEPSSSFDATLRFTYTDIGGRNYGIFARNINLDGSFFGPTGLGNIPGANRENVSFFQNASSSAPERLIENRGFNLVMNWSPSDSITLTSVTSYDWGDWIDTSDSDGLPVMVDEPIVTRAQDLNQFVQELRVASDFGGPLNFQAGILYTQDEVNAGFDYGFYFDPRCGAPCNSGLSATGTGFAQSNSFFQERESVSGYVRGEFEIAPTLTAFAGIRQSWDEVKVSDFDAFIGDNTDVRLFPIFADESARDSFENTSFEAGLNWEPTPDVLVYASYHEGYRTGAINSQGFTDISEINFAPPETATSYELGVKSTIWDRLVTFNAAVFQTDYKNQQVIASEEGGLLFPLRSISGSSILGFEADLTIRPSRRFSLYLGVGVLDPQYDSDAVISGPSGLSVANNQIINASEFTFNANTDVVILETESGSLDFNFNAAYTSEVFFDAFESKSEDGYWLANARLAYTTDRFTIGAGVKNLFNAKYFTYGLDLQSLGFDYFQRGLPRQYGIDATVRF